ncbi:hypothetical protein CC78DRAFT_573713 [Lojkania enalia]|uniref:Uncharacterized protein n=1 Tax=Lojkania enalia TaxID=147567 RepID=A0A9P4NBY7_9PLEO|nr:hypothetical protein CC78DRAFT_573713 [Didymosphaeria enalia]
MAGTRRRSRISDTAAVQQQQQQQQRRSAPRAASTVIVDQEQRNEDRVDARRSSEVDYGAAVAKKKKKKKIDDDVVEMIDIPERSKSSSGSKSTTGMCKNCGGRVGEFYNSWHQVTGTYYLPTLLGSYNSKLRPHGKQTAASMGTDIDGCLIQPLACPSCSDTLGFTALDVPPSKQSFRYVSSPAATAVLVAATAVCLVQVVECCTSGVGLFSLWLRAWLVCPLPGPITDARPAVWRWAAGVLHAHRLHRVLTGRAAIIKPASRAFRDGRDFFKLPRIELRCELAPNQTSVVEPQVDPAVPDPLPVDDSEPSSPVPVIRPSADDADDMEVDTRPPHASQPPPPPSGPLLLPPPPPPAQPAPPPHPHHHHEQQQQNQQSQQSQHHDAHHHHHQPVQPVQQVEANRPSLPPPPPPIRSSPGAPLPPVHSLPLQKSPSNPLPLPSPSPGVKPVHDVPYVQPPSTEGSAGLANRTRELPPVVSHPHPHSHSPSEQHRQNGQYYPRPPQDVQLDAIERLQTQISQNSGALMIHGRDMRRFEESVKQQEDFSRDVQGQLHHQSSELRRVDDAIGRLQHEMRGIRELLETLSRDVQAAARANGQGIPGQSVSAQDSALELMAAQVSVVSQKVNEVDTLKITIEIMKNKIQRLEEAAAGAPSLQSGSHPFPSPREPSAHSAHSSHTVPSYHTTPSTVPHISTPIHPAQRPASFHSHGNHSTATPEVSQRAEPAQAQSGWVTVNTSAKRSLPNGVDDPHDPIGEPVGSPKRPKLAPIEPRVAFGSSQQATPHQQHIVYDQMDTDDSESRIPPHTHSLPSQHSRDSIPESTLASQHAAYPPYNTQDAPSDDSWRPESQRIIEHRTPRGRGRGGGPGSRGGRGRKSIPAQVHLGTPEWEREDWQGIAESQTSPDGFYNHAARSGRGILRRGSGGGGGASRVSRPSSSSGRAISLGLQGVTPGISHIGLPADPYAHTKKTRTKPTRNADGILIRKDGRPDMRSQSSAANLRKVHARKEEQKSTDRSFTPTPSISNLQHATSMDADTPSPTAFGPDGQNLTRSVQKKHHQIMGKMFPGGVEESRKEHDYSRKVFEHDQDHTAHPRGQHHHYHHHHHQQNAPHSPLEIKREQIEERRIPDSQTPEGGRSDGDADMDRSDHADDEAQSLSGGSENSGRDSQYHDAANHEGPRQPSEPQENGAPAPQSTADSSQTVQAASTITS